MNRSIRTRSLALTLILAITGVSGLATSVAFGQAASPAAAAAKASAPLRAIAKWNLTSDTKLAIEGFDPVAYFPEGGGAATKGDAKFTHEYGGVKYQFANEKNKAAFIANPSKYEPAYGGWCAWAMKDGEQVEIDAKSFIVRDGRLFLFYNGFFGDTKAKWLKGAHNSEATEADGKWQKLSGESPRSGKSLASQLDAKRQEAEKNLPPAVVEKLAKSNAELEATGIAAKALAVGAKAPEFNLPDATGKMKSLKAMLADGPVVATFYRGGWCPYCNIQLHEYQQSLSEIRALGAQLVAISPQLPDGSMSTAEKNKLEFAVLSDVGNSVAKQFNIVYTIPEAAAPMYKPLLAKANGEGSDTLPLAATYVINRDGIITYAFVDTDYRKRAEPSDILAALKAIKPATPAK